MQRLKYDCKWNVDLKWFQRQAFKHVHVYNEGCLNTVTRPVLTMRNQGKHSEEK